MSGERPGAGHAGRPYKRVWFDCCRTYARVYRNREATAYEGRCPRCRRSLRMRIAPDGTDADSFRAR